MEWTREKIDFIRETSNLLTGEAYKLFCERFPDATSYKGFAVKKARENCCNAECRKLKWKPEWLKFIEGTRGMNREVAYQKFIEQFGEVITPTAFHNQRSRSGASPSRPHGSNRKRPLYSESNAKKYTIIKVAEPDVWISKARWIYEETHPGELTEPGDEFHFANGNKNDYSPENIIKVQQKERTIFIQLGGADQDPDVTKTRLLQAKLKVAQLDLGERIGLVQRTSGGRRWKNK